MDLDAQAIRWNALDNPLVRLVVAHHMVGNTYSYTTDQWAEDIRLASSYGIDGFVLNVGNDPWQKSQVASAYTAASSSLFKLFLSFDMTSLPGSSTSDADALRKYIMTYDNHPNQLKLKGKAVVSTFSGEKSTFGQKDAKTGWRSVFNDESPPVHFIPSFFDTALLDSPVVNGEFHWNGAWPMGNHSIDFQSDFRRISANKGRTYMAAVSPWFFTHYGPESWNKNWLYRADDWLYNSRWEMLVENRSYIDIVQILSWNDYGESHYIGPIRKDQPNSQAWVEGFDHQGWLKMTAYYATAFKTGMYPHIQKDEIYLWGRPHASNANPFHPAAPRPDNADWTLDFLWAVVFAVAPAKVTLTSGSSSQEFQVPAGVSKLKLACNCGTQSATLSRNQTIVLRLYEKGFQFTDKPEVYNFNAFVAVAP